MILPSLALKPAKNLKSRIQIAGIEGAYFSFTALASTATARWNSFLKQSANTPPPFHYTDYCFPRETASCLISPQPSCFRRTQAVFWKPSRGSRGTRRDGVPLVVRWKLFAPLPMSPGHCSRGGTAEAAVIICLMMFLRLARIMFYERFCLVLYHTWLDK